jgi:hypothetical protein
MKITIMKRSAQWRASQFVLLADIIIIKLQKDEIGEACSTYGGDEK